MNVLRQTISVSFQQSPLLQIKVKSLLISQTNLIRNSFRNSRNFHPILTSSLLNRKMMKTEGITMYSSTAALENNTKGIFQKMFGGFVNSKSVKLKKIMKFPMWNSNSFQRLRASSTLLYENVADRINYREFFDEFNMPDTFNSWFLVTELHCWLLLTRVMGEGSESGQDGRFLRNCIVEAMWTDVSTRAKKLSLDNPSASRAQVQILSEQFQATLINYDEGLMSDDKILANALWRRFFDMNCDDYTKLEKLVKYVRQVSLQLDHLTREELLQRPKIEWTKIGEWLKADSFYM